ncbi:hypothetical protein ACF1CY_002572 [Providencia rettgeri]
MREKDIVHENGKFWVLRDKDAYNVMQSGVTHSVGDIQGNSAYAGGGVSIPV